MILSCSSKPKSRAHDEQDVICAPPCHAMPKSRAHDKPPCTTRTTSPSCSISVPVAVDSTASGLPLVQEFSYSALLWLSTCSPHCPSMHPTPPLRHCPLMQQPCKPMITTIVGHAPCTCMTLTYLAPSTRRALALAPRPDQHEHYIVHPLHVAPCV